VALLCSSAVPASERAAIELESPGAGDHAVVRSELAFVAGRVAWFGEQKDALDLILLVDVSDSTDLVSAAHPPAAPGIWQRIRAWLGRPQRTPPTHTLLGDEIRAARDLLAALDPATTRVGVVAFGGDFDPESPDAWTVVPLTADFAAARAGLARLLRRGSAGLTNPSAGVHRALAELLGTQSSGAPARTNARRALVAFTDGRGPWDVARDGDVPAVRRAERAGVRIDVVAFGEEGERADSPGRAWAAQTGGVWLAAGEHAPHALAQALRYAAVSVVRVRNRTLGALAEEVPLAPDGSFACLVALRTGRNQVEIDARLPDGRWIERRLELERAEDAPLPALSGRLLAQRRRLLAARLHASPPSRAVSVEPEAPAALDPAARD
jgi:hypothetical protein